ncbi:hypothetical protein E1263_23295 [Kribbella antibiotica]|uniref:Ig-like domain repeat protein n=1 Tax=Kribbella antibiotica TaxID=190195 RepID=A0A4R4ZJ07_9ACTN|nr:hypothetical protein [Kribbella antibiotica]TDD57519.1 hypothetical protein E1263_23295 [Kribbella antibiotica]
MPFRTRTIVSALGAVTFVGTALGAVPASAGSVDLQVESAFFNKTKVAVAGLNTVPVTLTVKATYKLGKPGQPMFAVLDSVDSPQYSPELYSEPLKLIDGTGTDGTWQGIVNVPSIQGGTLELSRVEAGVFDPKAPIGDNDLVSGVSLAVTGLHVPKITRTVSANPVPFGKPYSITWKVTDSATGKPYGSRLKVLATKGPYCSAVKGSAGAVQTNTAGVLVVPYAPADGDKLNCLLLPGTQAPIDSYALAPNRPGVVAATPDKTSAKVGTTVAVKGNVLGFTYDCPVNLQRLSGATQWRTLRSTKQGVSGRYSLPAQITAKGKSTYRVQFPACHQVLAGVSKSFAITGV